MRILILLLALAGLGLAQDTVTGDWTFILPTPQGDMNVEMTLKQEGSAITGEMGVAGGGPKYAIAKGALSGDKITLTVKRERQSGGAMTYEFAGDVTGGKSIKGKMSANVDGQVVEHPWNATKK
ncbi:MAG: hypothetical protein SFV54_22610 [Bryobacteraceae bacterium]|nr:hypothetical protein [Bryobacteraceae bacterium]